MILNLEHSCQDNTLPCNDAARKPPMLSTRYTTSPNHPNIRFGTTIRIEKPDAFNRGIEGNRAFSANRPTDALILGDSPYQSPGWQLYEQLCNANKSSANPIPAYPWGANSISRSADLYTGAMITGTGGGVTDGSEGVRFHFDRLAENLAELEKPTQSSALKKTLSRQIDRLNVNRRSALLLGGNISIDTFKGDSRTLFNHLLHFVREKQISPSYLWGQNSSQNSMAQTRAYYTAHNDTWHILKIFKNPRTGTVSGPPDSIRALSQAFRDIHLASGDKLYLGSEQEGVKAISPLRLNLTVWLYHLPGQIKALWTNLVKSDKRN